MAVSAPAERPQGSPDAVLVSLGPLVFLLVDAVFQDVLDSDALLPLDPRSYQAVPRVRVVALLLFGRGDRIQLWGVEPPFLTAFKSRPSFGPQLIAITPKAVDVDLCTSNRPEASAAGFVLQIRVVVHSASEDALSGSFDRMPTVRRPEAVCRPAHERLDAADFGAGHGVEFRKLDNPHAVGLQCGILRAEFGNVVSEPWLGQRAQRCRLLASLGAFQDQARIVLASGLEDTGHGVDEPFCAHRSRVIGWVHV